jgi:hypothetical protein
VYGNKTTDNIFSVSLSFLLLFTYSFLSLVGSNSFEYRC